MRQMLLLPRNQSMLHVSKIKLLNKSFQRFHFSPSVIYRNGVIGVGEDKWCFEEYWEFFNLNTTDKKKNCVGKVCGNFFNLILPLMLMN
jgi:hypothetical protein